MNKEQVIISAEKKRNKKILKFLVPATIVMIILAAIMGIYVTSRGNKEPATADDFINAAYNCKYELYNVEEEVPDSVASAIIAKKSDNNSVTFLEFKKDADAKSYAAGTARKYKSVAKKENISNIKQVNYENYEYYTASAKGKYMRVVRVKNTVVFASGSEECGNDVEKIIASLGY